MVLRRIVPSSPLFLIIIAFAVALAQQSARKIVKIEVVGLVRLSVAEAIATSGLKVGTMFSVTELDAAGQKLVDSGLFAKVGYRTTSKGNLVKIVFQVEENKGGQSPVIFDNFVWFTKDELITAIKHEVPSFDGTAADAGRMTDDIKRALQNLLEEQHLGGIVEYAPELAGLNSNRQEHVYSVSGVPIPICSLHFPGAANVSEKKLVWSSKQLTEENYSQKSAIAFARYTLFPIYREAGQLRAQFAQPITKLAASANCKDGVELSIPVEEGPIFLWEKAEWTGNETLAAPELDAALGMKNGDLANGVKIDKGLFQVGRRYGNTGHLDVSLAEQPVFDEAASRVSYKIVVKEGPQYRMGKLIIKGLSEADAQSLQQKWQLKSGEVFDSSYFERFLKTDARDEIQKIIAARQAAGKAQPQIGNETNPNRQTLTADVTIEFKS